MLRAAIVGLVAFWAAQQPAISQDAALEREIIKALEDVRGKVDTHFSLPRDKPYVYALSFELSDKLEDLCPGSFPKDFARTRAQAYMAYLGYNRINIERSSFGPQGTWIDGALLMFRSEAAAGLPSTIARRRILSVEPEKLARMLIQGLNGCNSEHLKNYVANLTAIGTFGAMKRVEFKTSFVRKEETENGVGFVCYYDENPSDATEHSQGYRKISNLNTYTYGTTLNAFLQRLQREPHGSSGGTVPRPLMLRSDCPLTPDPEFATIRQWVDPKEGVVPPGATRGQRIAAYYVDRVIPNLWEIESKRKRNLKPLSPSFLTEYRVEIARYEDLPIIVTDRKSLEEKNKLYRTLYGERFFELDQEATTYGLTYYIFYRDIAMKALNLR